MKNSFDNVKLLGSEYVELGKEQVKVNTYILNNDKSECQISKGNVMAVLLKIFKKQDK